MPRPAGASASPPDIAVVVPTFRRVDGLDRLLRALALQTLPVDRWELIIVDDCSGSPIAETIEELARNAPFRARVVHADRNGGPGKARNLGWRSCDAPFLSFTDDDCVPHPEWLASGLSLLRSSPRLGIVQGPTVRPPESENHRMTCFTVVREVLRPSPWFEGCNLFWRREALESVGGFDEQLGRFGEETSAAWSAMDSGWERGWAEDGVVEHCVEERSWKWHLWFYYMDRNTVYLASKHPGLRSEFWRPWALRKENALFALAVAGLLLGVRWRFALLLTAPYLKWLHPPLRHPRYWPGWLSTVFYITVHAASFAGKLEGSAKSRIIVV